MGGWVAARPAGGDTSNRGSDDSGSDSRSQGPPGGLTAAALLCPLLGTARGPVAAPPTNYLSRIHLLPPSLGPSAAASPASSTTTWSDEGQRVRRLVIGPLYHSEGGPRLVGFVLRIPVRMKAVFFRPSSV